MPYNSDIKGYMWEHELQVLERLALQVPKKGIIVEVGSFLGRSSVCLAMSAPEATVYCIDDFYDFDWTCDIKPPNPNTPDNFMKHNCPEYGEIINAKKEFIKNTQHLQNIIPVQGKSPYQITYEAGDIDMFFLDANHMNPNDWDNICHWVPMVKPGGIICGHDYDYKWPDVIHNVHRLEQALHKQATLHFTTSIWSFQIDNFVSKDELEKLAHHV